METALAARALGLKATVAVSAAGQDAAVAGGALAAAAGKFSLSYHTLGAGFALVSTGATPPHIEVLLLFYS